MGCSMIQSTAESRRPDLGQGLLLYSELSRKGEENMETKQNTSAWKLRYRQPAAVWEEALPLGNGHMGAMVFGGTDKELISLNEDTLWSGFPGIPIITKRSGI